MAAVKEEGEDVTIGCFCQRLGGMEAKEPWLLGLELDTKEKSSEDSEVPPSEFVLFDATILGAWPGYARLNLISLECETLSFHGFFGTILTIVYCILFITLPIP